MFDRTARVGVIAVFLVTTTASLNQMIWRNLQTIEDELDIDVNRPSFFKGIINNVYRIQVPMHYFMKKEIKVKLMYDKYVVVEAAPQVCVMKYCTHHKMRNVYDLPEEADRRGKWNYYDGVLLIEFPMKQDDVVISTTTSEHHIKYAEHNVNSDNNLIQSDDITPILIVTPNIPMTVVDPVTSRTKIKVPASQEKETTTEDDFLVYKNNEKPTYPPIWKHQRKTIFLKSLINYSNKLDEVDDDFATTEKTTDLDRDFNSAEIHYYEDQVPHMPGEALPRDFDDVDNTIIDKDQY